MARIEPEFIKRNAKLMGQSIDPAESRGKWRATSRKRRRGDIEVTYRGD
jgi:alkyl hydroperoxide reductase subunit AhpC